MADYRANPTDREQAQVEEAAFDSASPYFDDKTAASPIGQRAALGAAERNVGGVVVPASDRIGAFPSDTVGRA